MSTQNIAIVMAPNLLWTRLEEGFNMTATGTHSLVVDALIQHCDWFFPEGQSGDLLVAVRGCLLVLLRCVFV